MRVLQVLTNRNIGGVSIVLVNYNEIIDHEKVIFDAFICSDDEPNILDENITNHGGIVHSAPAVAFRNFKKIKAEFRRVLLENKYEVIHLHAINSNFLFLKIAKECGVSKIIVHAHSIKFSVSRLKSIRNYFLSKIGKKYITHYCACSKLSAKKLFGKNVCDIKNLFIVENVVDTERFSFNLEKRKLFRNQYNLDSKFVIGTVGRLSKEKNIPFLIDIFKELLKINSDSVLILIGDGSEREVIEKNIITESLENNVLMLGRCNNVSELINIFDYFALTSIFEGYPLVLLEAQANGLKCIVSTNVPNDVNKGLCEFVPLKKGAKKWAELIASGMNFDVESRIKSQKSQDSLLLGNLLTEWYIK